MRQILKFKLNPRETWVRVTEDSKLLDIKVQRGTPCVWIEVGTEDEVTWKFDGYMTGFGYDQFEGKYVDTVLLENDDFVLHYYVVIK